MSGSTGTVTAQQQPNSKGPRMTPAQQNAYARQLIYGNAKPIIQRASSQTFTNMASGSNVHRIIPLQVGFLRRFIVVVTATIANTDATHAGALTQNGVDNIISNFTFNDFTGNPRHNASGRALSQVEAFKYGRIPGAALTSDSVSGFGSNVGSNLGPALAENASTTIRRVFEIPVMVDNQRFMAGGLWLGTNNQTTSLNITYNSQPVVASTADPLNAVYQLAAGGVPAADGSQVTSLTSTVYQEYWNDLVVDSSGNPILPQLDISTAYMITETNSGMTLASGQQSAWNFPTFSKMLGVYLTYDNAGVFNPGTDISRIAYVVSNFAVIKEYDAFSLDRITRDICGASFPDGTYGIASRQHPMDVKQYPSLQLQFTPSAASAGALVMITTELLRPVQYMAAASGMGAA